MGSVLPALLLLLFSTWCGTWGGAADGARSVVAHLVLLGLLALAGDFNPLRLSRWGNLLLGGLVFSVALSFLFSPVPRAGRVGVLLLPAFLAIPPFVERCWPDAQSRRRGLLAIAIVVGLVAGWALLDMWHFETRVTALPLGHHNLLAAWLVALLPISLLPWRDGGFSRVVAGGAGLLALAALVATRSLSGLMALGVVLVVAVAWRPKRATKWRPLGATLLALGLLALGWAGRSRLQAVLTGNDLSTDARRGYLEAAWRGASQRPLVGWGPGSVSWTLSSFLEPRPGVHPPDQVVADPHSLPFRLVYEIGGLGLALLVALGVVVLRTNTRFVPTGPSVRHAALLGLLGWGIASLAGRPLSAPALPLVAMMLLGMLQASRWQASELRASELEASPPRATRGLRGGMMATAMALAVFLAPADFAHLLYDRATAANSADQVDLLRRASRLDPDFPLYPIRLALLDPPEGSAEHGADLANGIAHFHLLAGLQAGEEDQDTARDAWLRACELNPLGALAPFHLALAAEDQDPRASVWAARALLADPILLAAEAWRQRPGLRDAALGELRGRDGVDPAWTQSLAKSLESIRRMGGPTRRVVLEMDGEDAASLSLHAFRRRPWPAYIDDIPLLADALPEIRVTALAKSRGAEAQLFLEPECGLP